MPQFPDAIYTPRETENLPGIVYDVDDKKNMFSEDFQNLGGEINAIETILGINPEGGSDSVGARLSLLDTLLNIGSLTDGYLMRWDGNKFVNSGIYQSGSNVGIGTTAPGAKLTVAGNAYTYVNGGNTTANGNTPLFASLNNAVVASATYGWLFYDNDSNGNLDLYRRNGSTTGVHVMSFDRSNGNVGIGTTAPTAKSDINSDILRLRTAKTPSSSGAAGNQGDICWDSGYVYVCISTNSWIRVALSSW